MYLDFFWQVITDWHIAAYVSVLVVIDVIIFVITMSHPQLRPRGFQYPSSEHGIETNVIYYYSYSKRIQSFFTFSGIGC